MTTAHPDQPVTPSERALLDRMAEAMKLIVTSSSMMYVKDIARRRLAEYDLLRATEPEGGDELPSALDCNEYHPSMDSLRAAVQLRADIDQALETPDNAQRIVKILQCACAEYDARFRSESALTPDRIQCPHGYRKPNEECWRCETEREAAESAPAPPSSECMCERCVEERAMRVLERTAQPSADVVDGQGWFAYDQLGREFETFDSAEAAIKYANESLAIAREEAPEGWPEGTEQICWGMICGGVVETERRPATDGDVCHPDCQTFVEYELETFTPWAEAISGAARGKS
jgi:hypothetical protein